MRNSAKPGRAGPEAWVVHASSAESILHLKNDPAIIIDSMLAALGEAVIAALPGLMYVTANRWRYARLTSAGVGLLWDGDRRISVCGDWLRGPRVGFA